MVINTYQVLKPKVQSGAITGNVSVTKLELAKSFWANSIVVLLESCDVFDTLVHGFANRPEWEELQSVSSGARTRDLSVFFKYTGWHSSGDWCPTRSPVPTLWVIPLARYQPEISIRIALRVDIYICVPTV